MNNKNTMQYRQGDVLIERISNSTVQRRIVPKGRIVLAHGEATGHAHEIHDVRVVEHFAPEFPQDRGDNALTSPMILALGKPAKLNHQEHAPAPLEVGTYRVRRQREYAPEQLRNVAD